jgi:hypothetical protein
MTPMKVQSPIGEFEYRVKGVRFDRGGIEVKGSLGEWETTMVVERSDLIAWGRRAVPAAAAVAALVAARRLAASR